MFSVDKIFISLVCLAIVLMGIVVFVQHKPSIDSEPIEIIQDPVIMDTSKKVILLKSGSVLKPDSFKILDHFYLVRWDDGIVMKIPKNQIDQIDDVQF